jgi:hypothetical protein
MKVIVLGCGPAGLMAVHAAKLAGASEIRCVSKKRKSHLYGAQYLHAPIPGMTDSAPVSLRYMLEGSVTGYRDKVYGSTSPVTVSPSEFEGEHDAWDIRGTYDNLWREYSNFIIDSYVGAGTIRAALEDFDLVVNTTPRPPLCDDYHQFHWQDVWIAGDAPNRGQIVPQAHGLKDNTVVCNGQSDVGWYRISKVFNYGTVEYPGHGKKPPLEMLVPIKKPLTHNCTCHEGVLHVGRYGKWTKGALSHEAFQEVFDRCLDMPA